MNNSDVTNIIRKAFGLLLAQFLDLKKSGRKKIGGGDFSFRSSVFVSRK